MDRDPLADHEAEVAVLGACMIDPTRYHEVAPLLTPEDFDLPKHGTIWEVFAATVAAGRAIDDIRVLANELRTRERLNTVGGAQYLADLTDSTPTGVYIVEHALIVARLARQRRVRDLFRAFASKASSHSADVDALLAGAIRELSSEGARITRESSVCTAHEAVLAVVQRYEETGQRRALDPHAWAGIPQPLPSLRRVMGGWRPGELTVMSAGTSVGKTAFALQSASTAAAAGTHVLIVSLEMDRVELMQRVIAERGGVASHIVAGRAPAGTKDLERFQRGIEASAKLPITICDAGQQTVGGVLALVHGLRAKGITVGLIVMDYLQLVQPDTRRKDGTREQEVSEIGRALKVALAKATGAHVLALSQENDDGRTRESKAIEQHANNILRLTREKDPPAGEPTETATLHVIKQRNGERNAKLPLIYQRATTTFYDEDQGDFPSNVLPFPVAGADTLTHDPEGTHDDF